MQHDDHEYGSQMASDGQHFGGPFFIDVPPQVRVEELRSIIKVSSHCALLTSKDELICFDNA